MLRRPIKLTVCALTLALPLLVGGCVRQTLSAPQADQTLNATQATAGTGRAAEHSPDRPSPRTGDRLAARPATAPGSGAGNMANANTLASAAQAPPPAPQARERAVPTVEAPTEVAVLTAPEAVRLALPAVPDDLPPGLAGVDERTRTDLLSRPPVAPPVPERAALPPLPPAGGPGDPDAARRCRAAVGAAKGAVLRFLTLPPAAIEQTAWVEEALRVTELASGLCQGMGDGLGSGESAAAYWRATAFLLHGQYARAALHFRRVEDGAGPYAAHGYAKALADMLDACGRSERAALDAWRAASLHEAAGRTMHAADLYHAATATACRPLRDRARARLSLLRT